VGTTHKYEKIDFADYYLPFKTMQPQQHLYALWLH